MKSSSILGALAAGAAVAVLATAIPANADSKTVSTTATSKDPCSAKKTHWARLQCENYNNSAPGDEYFGRLKLSYLGINNTFRDEAIRAGQNTVSSTVINKVGFADEALRDWAKRYPRDPDLARSYYLATLVLSKIYTQQAQNEAYDYMHVLATKFASTYFGKIEKTNLHRGFTMHWYADASPCGASPQPDPPAPALPRGVKLQVLVPACIATPAPASSP